MNYTEAIAIVRGVQSSFQEDCFDEIEALDLAIKALREKDEESHNEYPNPKFG